MLKHDEINKVKDFWSLFVKNNRNFTWFWWF